MTSLAATNTPALPSRRLFTLLVETRCNSYCVFCGQREVDEAVLRVRRRLGLVTPETQFGALRGRYTLESATQALGAARADGFDELLLQGGEPTIFPEICALIRAARGMGFRAITIVTNGRKLRDPGFARELLDAGLDALTVSVLGADAATHDGLSAAPGSFDGLVDGLRAVRDELAKKPRPLTVSATVVTCAPNLEQLGDITELLAPLGVSAIQVHPVVFENLADVPELREKLRMDLARVAPALARAKAAGQRLGVRVHATHIPLCLHPTLDREEVALMVRDSAVEAHAYGAAAYSFIPAGRKPLPERCAGCLVESRCAGVDPEHARGDSARAIHPLSPARACAAADDALAAMDPSDPGAALNLVAMIDAYQGLERLSRQGMQDGVARFVEALADLALFRASRGDHEGSVLAVWCLLGLKAPDQRGFPDLLRYAAMPDERAAREASALPVAQRWDGPRLRLGGRFEIALAARKGDDGAMDVERAQPVTPAARTPAERVARAVFLFHIASRLRDARRMRLRDGFLETDAGDGVWKPTLRELRAGAIEFVGRARGE